MDRLVFVSKITDEFGNTKYIYLNTELDRIMVSDKEVDTFDMEHSEAVDDFINDNTPYKGKLFTSKLNKKLAALGIVVTLLCVEPKIVEGLNWVAKRASVIISQADNSYDAKKDDFVEKLCEIIDNNEYYTESERESLKSGLPDFYNDWGHLLNETNKRYILTLFARLKIKREVDTPRWATATYGKGVIKLSMSNYNGADDDVTSHESGHALSDHGLTIGSINGYGMGFALNEAINTVVTVKYFDSDNTYKNQTRDLRKLTLLTGNIDCFIKYYLTGDISDVVDSIKSNCPGIKESDIKLYISMMDLQLFFDTYKIIEGYTLNEEFYENKDALYHKMLSARVPNYESYFSLDYLNINYWEGTVIISKGLLNYRLPLEKLEYIAYDDSFLDQYAISYSDYEITHFLGYYSFEDFNSSDFKKHVEEKFSGNEEMISLFYDYYSRGDAESNDEDYLKLFLYSIDADNIEPFVAAMLIRDRVGIGGLGTSASDDEKTVYENSYDMMKETEEIINKMCSPEISYWFNKTDISFSDFPARDTLNDTYNEIENAKYKVVDDTTVLICVDEGCTLGSCFSREHSYFTPSSILRYNRSSVSYVPYEKIPQDVLDEFGATEDSKIYCLAEDEPIDISTLEVLQYRTKEVTPEMKEAFDVVVNSESFHR